MGQAGRQQARATTDPVRRWTYRGPGSPYRVVLKALAVVLAIWVALAVCIYVFEFHDRQFTLGDAMWYAAVTFTTVGYGDYFATTGIGRIFAVGLFILSVSTFSFLIGVIQNAVAERRRQKELGMDGTTFANHVVICSWSRIAQVALRELLAAGRQCAVICENPNDIPLIKALGDERVLFVTVGDLTAEETLARVNITAASTVVAASEDDTENLILALQIRTANPNARIVVAIKRSELRNTLTASGVTYVASPFEMSGRLVASAAFEPEVAKFIDDISSGADDDDAGEEPGYDLQQFMIPPNSNLANSSAAQLNAALKQMQGPLLVAVAKHVGGGHFKVYPHPADDMVLNPYDSMIVLGNAQQNGRVAQMLGVVQGR